MRRVGTTVLAAALLLGATHATQAAKVRTEPAEGADFSRYRSFAWREASAALPPESHKVLLDTAVEILRSKGLREAPAAEADVILSYKVLAVDRADVKAYGYADPDKWAIADYGTTDVRAYIEGRLTVYAEERESAKLVWTAEGEAAVADAARATKAVRKLAERMFRAWPNKKN